MQIKSKPNHAGKDIALAEAKALLRQLCSAEISQTTISEATGIHQGQVSRLLRGEFVQLKGNALILCKYANSYFSSVGVAHAKWTEKLVDSALSLWDGSESSAERAVTLLQALRPFVRP